MACFLLLETGGKLLLETSGALLLEFCNDVIPAPMGGAKTVNFRQSYDKSRWEWEDKQRIESEKAIKDKQLAETEAKVAQLEVKRAKSLDNERMQIELVTLMRQYHDLQLEQERLNQLLLMYQRDEDDILILLYSLPFVN